MSSPGSRRMPRICIFTETYYPLVGGGETQAKALAEGLVGLGVEVIILTRRSDCSLLKTEAFGAITAHRLPPIGPEHGKKWGLLITAFPALWRLRNEYDLIFVSGFRIIGIVALVMGKLLGKSCVLKADSLGEMSGTYFAGGLAKIGLRPTTGPF